MPLPIHESAPVERRLLRDVVYNRLYTSILDGTLEPGETLVDDTLTTWLGVSRTPIREALMKLADIGLVELAPNRYTRVASIDYKALNEAVYAYGLLGEYAAKTTADSLSIEALTALEETLQQILAASAASDRISLGESINAFMMVFFEETENEALFTLSSGLSPQLIRYISVFSEPFGTTPLADQFGSIVQGAKERDANATAQSVAELFTLVHANLSSAKRRSDQVIDEKPVI